MSEKLLNAAQVAGLKGIAERLSILLSELEAQSAKSENSEPPFNLAAEQAKTWGYGDGESEYISAHVARR